MSATGYGVNALSFHEVRKNFGRANALDGVSFDVPKGSVFALVGPNGAGKTTLLSCVANFLVPTSGRIAMFGHDITRGAHRFAGRFSMLPQDAGMVAEARVMDLLVLWSRLAGLGVSEARDESHRVLGLVGLAASARQKARELSHGMLKRLTIAQAFLGSPELILLDEPTSGLDPENAAAVRDLIADMVGDRTVLISSHNLLELQSLCTHCAIMDRGSVVTVGPMAQLLGGHERVRIRLNTPCDSALLAGLEALTCVRSATVDERQELRLTLAARNETQRDRAVAEVLRLLDTHGRVPRSMHQGVALEERFLELVGGRSDGLGSR